LRTWRRAEQRRTAKAQKRADGKEKDGNESDDTAKSVTFHLGHMGAWGGGGTSTWGGGGGTSTWGGGGGAPNAAMETDGDGIL